MSYLYNNYLTIQVIWYKIDMVELYVVVFGILQNKFANNLLRYIFIRQLGRFIYDFKFSLPVSFS